MASETHKRRTFRHWVKWFVAISTTISLLILAFQGRLNGGEVMLYAAFIYILSTFEHPITTNAIN